MKAILPKPLNAKAMKAQLTSGLETFGEDVLKDFESITATWQGEKPEIVKHTESTSKGLSVFIGAENDGSKGYLKLLWIEEGTEEHPIYAGIYTGRSTKRTLAFRTGFRPKTRQGYIGSFRGASFGPLATPAFVQHPGTKARHFTRTIAKKRYKLYKQRMAEAMARAAKVSGHAI